MQHNRRIRTRNTHWGQGTFEVHPLKGYRLERWAEFPLGKKRFRGQWAESRQLAIDSWENERKRRMIDTVEGGNRNEKLAEASLRYARLDRVKNQLSPSTLITHDVYAKKLATALPDIKLKDVNTGTATLYRTWLHKKGNKNRTIDQTMWWLMDVMRRARAEGLILLNPFTTGEMGQVAYKSVFSSPREKHAILYYTDQEMQLIINEIPKDAQQNFGVGMGARQMHATGKYHTDVYHVRMRQVGWLSGLRSGEICGLQWKHITFMQNGELGVIKVEQKVNPKAANMIDKPKGNKPAESVYFGPELNQVFLDQKNAWRIDRMRCNHVDAWALHAKAKQALEDSRQLAQIDDGDIPPEGFVFPTRMGAPRIPSQLEDHVRYQDQRLGIYIKGRNTHGGRRTYATDIIGHMPIQFVGQQLRHAPGQEQMLFDHYADVKNGKNVERLKAYMEDYYKLGS
tara:strand:+ start:785 stop:2149 length:1365 start_codon:yes stop_codon:yes gene_type:complete